MPRLAYVLLPKVNEQGVSQLLLRGENLYHWRVGAPAGQLLNVMVKPQATQNLVCIRGHGEQDRDMAGPGGTGKKNITLGSMKTARLQTSRHCGDAPSD